ncbi:MAG: hypothetical protein ACR2JJ_12000 [Sphingomicrobium sp.]
MSNSKGAWVPAHYVQAFGPAAGILLGQIAYWHTKAKGGQNVYIVEKWGHRWLARSREQLQLETGLSASQVKSALKVLSTEQIIVVEQHLFGNKNISHIRLGADGPNWVGAELPPEAACSSQPEMAETANSIKSKTTLETKGEYGVPCTHVFSGNKEKGKKDKKHGVQEAGPAHASEPISATQLEEVYRTAFSEAYENEYLPPFGPKELGQISQLAAKCQPGTAPAVIDYAVRNWDLVTSIAASHQSAFNTPTMPSVGFMLAMVQSMVNGYLYAQKAPEPKTRKPFMPPPSAPPSKPKPEPMPTLEETYVLLGLGSKYDGLP